MVAILKEQLAERALRSLARTAFAHHYEVTKQPGWSNAEDHWNNNPAAQELWYGIVCLIAVGAGQQNRIMQAAGVSRTVREALPGLGGAPMPPMRGPSAMPVREAGPGLALIFDPEVPAVVTVATAIPGPRANGGENVGAGHVSDPIPSSPIIGDKG